MATGGARGVGDVAPRRAVERPGRTTRRPDAALRLIARLCAAAKVALSEETPGRRGDALRRATRARRVGAGGVDGVGGGTTRRRRRRRRRVDRVSIHRFSNHSRGRTKFCGRAGGTARTRGGGAGGGTPSRRRGARRGDETRGGGAETRGNPRAGEIAAGVYLVRVGQRVRGVGGGVGVRGTPRREVPAASRGSGEDAGRDALLGGCAVVGKAAESRAKNLRARLAADSHSRAGVVEGDATGTGTSAPGTAGTPVPDDAPDLFPPASSPPPLLLAHVLAGCGTARAAAPRAISIWRRRRDSRRRRRRRTRARDSRRSTLVPRRPSRH